MPLAVPLTPPSSSAEDSEGSGSCTTVLDPLNFVKVLIPVRFPTELNINLNCVSLLSAPSPLLSVSSPSQSSPSSSSLASVSTPRSVAASYSSPHSNGSSHHDRSTSTSFEPIDEVSQDEIERILKESHSEATSSLRDDYTECDLDLEDVDFDFQDAAGQVTSTTASGRKSEPETPSCHGGPESDDDDAEKEEEQSIDNPNPVPCVHCQGGRDHSASGDLIWPIQLDLDLVKTLLQLCPDFFEDFDEVEMDPMELTFAQHDDHDASSASASQDTLPSSTTSNTSTSTSGQPSPPNVQVDDSPLQPCMVRNKESLKVKLLLRRPMTQLIEQGILPPSKTPPAFAEQRVRLERARMGDLLKAKIQQRPARQELIRQHILEESDARVAPSLAEKQRMLKRARLADSLNDHLIHRPGPLELVKKNILHAPDAIIDQAIKEGVVPFKATSEGVIPGHVPSNIYLSEDESSSDLSSPAGTPDQSQSSSSSSNEPQQGKDVLPVAQSPTSTTATTPAQSSPILPSLSPRPPQLLLQSFVSNRSPTTAAVTTVSASDSTVPQPPPLPQPTLPVTHIQNELFSKIVKAAVTSSTTPPITSAQLTLSKLSTLEHQQLLSAVSQNQPPPRTLTTSQPNLQQGTVPQNAFSQQHASTGKTRTTKKSTPKIKATPKARQIKFHEYKGPPSAHKGHMQPPQPEVESSYELLLQQQQLFLQWQLEYRHKYPQIILPAVSKLASPTEVAATFASAVNAANAAAMSMVPGSIMTATTSSPLVRSPSTISSVMNSNNTGTSGQQPIAPAPPPITVQALVEKYNKTAATVTGTLPLKITMPQGSSTALADIRPKLTPSRSIDATSSSSSSSVTSSPKSTSHLDISKLNDWKVSDLKAELKKRNLPVSGAKPQLIERLKMADVSLQDESISSSSNGNSATAGKSASVKSEGRVNEESYSMELMDVSDGCGTSANGNNPPQLTTTTQVTDLQQNADGAGKSSNVAALNAAMLTLLQNNNLQNNGVIPVHILNALANVAKNANLKTGTNGKTQNVVVVDEKLIREQQIEQLQQALKNSQQQNPIKITPQQTAGAGQKHRIALQQHLQQKMQQQALQSQLQKLIHLHTLQQQQQQAQKVAQTQKPVPGKVASSPQQPQIQILSPKNPQQASSSTVITVGSESTNDSQDSTITLHQFDAEDGRDENPSSSAHVTLEGGLNHVPILSSGNEQQSTTTADQSSSPLIYPHINVPFRILQIETSGSHELRLGQDGGIDFSNIPQLQIRVKPPAFHTGESDSSQSTKSGSFSSDAGDPMDHSWLLKINENPPTPSSSTCTDQSAEPEPRKSVVKEYASFFESIANGDQKKEELKLQIPKPRRGFKSQMVDDVLEILIRNGELPPSAAQDPSTPIAGKSPEVLVYQPPPPPLVPCSSSNIPSKVDEDSKIGLSCSNATTPPTPPPLPPASFAVTLPTSITFSRSPTTNPLLSPFQNQQQQQQQSADSKGPPPPYPSNALSKEAQDILKISQDLSNFGKAHDQTTVESGNHVFAGPSPQVEQPQTELLGNLDYDSNSFAMLLDEVEKEALNNMDLDSHENHFQHEEMASTPFHETNSNRLDEEMRDESTVQVKQEDLLGELGTLLPPDLDVSMEMDYSDWLDQLLPESQQNTTIPNQNFLPLSSNNTLSSSLNNNFFMEYQHNSHPFGNRDPLLSSSVNIFPGDHSENGDLKNRGGTSPMAVGDNILWDFF